MIRRRIQSPIADMIELTHHLSDSEMLREEVYGSVDMDRTLIELIEKNKTKRHYDG